ncbi:MAG: aldehyde dehydrogenase family protein, partial [Hyphomicrobiales bacterium]
MTIAATVLDRLEDRDLLAAGLFVDGQWLGRASDGRTFEVTNPSTGAVLATLPDAGVAEAKSAIEAAQRAQGAWAAKTGKERAAGLRKLHELMVAHADDLAAIMTAEQGKPVAEAKGEVLYGASYVEWFGEEAKRVYGDTIPGHQADKRIIVIKQPVGVVPG